MPDEKEIAGIVLAGGQSSRMGEDKALLDYKGKPLVRHMHDMLAQVGLTDIFISGVFDGYRCIADDTPLNGPAEAIKSVLRKIPHYAGYLFVPVDMPLLSPALLHRLLAQPRGGYFASWPLPVYIAPPFRFTEKKSVFGFLEDQGIHPLTLPPEFEGMMKNANTPQEWAEIKAER